MPSVMYAWATTRSPALQKTASPESYCAAARRRGRDQSSRQEVLRGSAATPNEAPRSLGEPRLASAPPVALAVPPWG